MGCASSAASATGSPGKPASPASPLLADGPAAKTAAATMRDRVASTASSLNPGAGAGTPSLGGKKRKKTLAELREATGVTGRTSSLASAARSSFRRSGLRSFRLDDVELDAFAREYVDRVRPRDQFNKEISKESLQGDCLNYFSKWPRGTGAGELLDKPVPGPANVAERGVKISWLLGAWSHLKATTKRMLVPTRAFADLFVRPFLLDANGARGASGAVAGGEPAVVSTLFDFIPLEFRAPPHAYVCHAWDGWLRQILFLSELTTKDWPPDSAVWLDVFALPQIESGPNPELVAQTRDVVRAVGKTLVVFPGDGHDKFALLPVFRSWCLFEMAVTPPGQLQSKIGLHGDLGDVEFHKAVAERILNLSWLDAKAAFVTDKQAIDDLVAAGGLPGGASVAQAEDTIRQVCHAAFQARYANVTSPVIVKPSLGRFSSLSDVYDLDRNSLEAGRRNGESGRRNSPPSPSPNF